MRACLHSLSLVHCPWILSNSERGMLAAPPNLLHRPPLMMSRTVERFSGVRLGSGSMKKGAESAVFELSKDGREKKDIWGTKPHKLTNTTLTDLV